MKPFITLHISLSSRSTAVLAALGVATLCGLAAADVPNTFEGGQVLRAADLNANFAALDDRITQLPRPALTEWESYDPQISSLAAAQHTTTGSWRRVGDSIEIQIRTELTAAVVSSGWAWSLPEDLEPDPDKFLDAQVAGVGYLFTPEAGGTNQNLTVFWRSGFAAGNVLVTQATASGNWYVGNGQSYDAGTRVDFTARLPIAGFGVTADR